MRELSRVVFDVVVIIMFLMLLYVNLSGTTDKLWLLYQLIFTSIISTIAVIILGFDIFMD